MLFRICCLLGCLVLLPAQDKTAEEVYSQRNYGPELSVDNSPRRCLDVRGQWQFFLDRNGRPEGPGKLACLPTHWETHEGLRFDGTGWYERSIEAWDVRPGWRVLLHFDAVATQATVYWNGERVGEHLGPWTPFRCDVTDQVRRRPASGQHRLQVHIDEKVGHNTQGFLPVIQPHFGGIWQGIWLLEVPEVYFDDLAASVRGDWEQRRLIVSIPVRGLKRQQSKSQLPAYLKIAWRRLDHAETTWTSAEVALVPVTSADESEKLGQLILRRQTSPAQDKRDKSDQEKGGIGEVVGEMRQNEILLTWPVPEARRWSPLDPVRYQVRVSWPGQDTITLTAAFRDVTAKGERLLLNGEPFQVRGVLNWGYYPPKLAPYPSEQRWRSDLRLIRSWGFNLMKCCLWVPPRRLLEIADEEGVLVWMEYPTWHPKLDQQHREELLREYAEFFQHDRNHPCVVLRSLTCETGHQADLTVIQALYDLGKRMIPGALIVDDSSWIEWIRVGDFYDDHPYGNNHTWMATLRRLQNFIQRSRLGVKPLVLGEAIAADTWVATSELEPAIAAALADPSQRWTLDERGLPYWVPGFFEANRQWLKLMAKVCGGPLDEARLSADSRDYAWLMRQYQMQAFRWAMPSGGYVVSVIRDFPLASMGLLDYRDGVKWPTEAWRWHTQAPPDRDPWPRTALPVPDVEPSDPSLKVVSALNLELLRELEAGARVFLQPNGQECSLPLRSHWFLRGGPVVNPHHPLIRSFPDLHSFLVRSQHFDLAGDVIPELDYLEEIDPLLLLWDNHDIREVKTHGLVFETRVGQGRLLVSALRHEGDGNTAGRGLKNLLLWHLASGPPPRRALSQATLEGIRTRLREKRLSLVGQPWRFRPGDIDPKTLSRNAALDDTWKKIEIGRHWEAQGYPSLDGWACYQLEVTIPKDWPAKTYFLHCEGVDDYAEVFVNGRLIGSLGDLANRRTAFDQRASFAITDVKPGETIKLAVRVYDWYGAGGLHRPLHLSTEPRHEGPHFVR